MVRTMTENLDELKKDFLDKFQGLYGPAPEGFEEKVYSESAQKLLDLKKNGIAASVFDCEVCKDSKRIRLTNDKKDKLFGRTFWCPDCTDEDDLVRATGVDNAYKHWTLQQLDLESDFVESCVADLRCFLGKWGAARLIWLWVYCASGLDVKNASQRSSFIFRNFWMTCARCLETLHSLNRLSSTKIN